MDDGLDVVKQPPVVDTGSPLKAASTSAPLSSNVSNP